eukprot:6472489-Karenia_brevis.AAC.1
MGAEVAGCFLFPPACTIHTIFAAFAGLGLQAESACGASTIWVWGAARVLVRGRQKLSLQA